MKRGPIFLKILTALFLFPALAFSLTVMDSTGQTVFLKKPARRMITLAPNLAELVDAAGASKYLVGVSRYSHFSSSAARLAVIGDENGLDLERILSLKPDLIIAWYDGNSLTTLKRLQALHLRVYYASFHDFQSIPKVIRDIGIVANTNVSAARSISKFNRRYQNLQRKYSNQKKVTVFYELWSSPLMTLTSSTLIGQAIHLCGGQNIFGGLRTEAPVISLENVLVANPDVILVGLPGQEAKEAIHFWKAYAFLKAVKKHQIYAISTEALYRPSPRMLSSVSAICQVLDRARRR